MDSAGGQNNDDVIEISDDSCEAIYDGVAGTSSGAKRYNFKSAHSESSFSSTSSDNTDTSTSSGSSVQFIDDDSESEPEYECDYWDDDCRVVEIAVDTKLIQGIHHLKYISLPEANDAKRMKLSVGMNDELSDEPFFRTIQENYINDNAYEDKGIELICDPWKVLVVQNLVQDPSILDAVRKEFDEVLWNIRTMDLFEFSQSEDLKNLEHMEHINMVYEFLKTDLMAWVARLTGLELVQVSATCSFYGDTDFLLVHDDQRGTRAVAFVLYLTGREDWASDWGGALQLLNTDDAKQPLDVKRNILPRNNQLVLFPVSEASYHQIEEVQCKNFCRLSINGWFHTKEPLVFGSPTYTPPEEGLFSTRFHEANDCKLDLHEFIDDSYLTDHTIVSIQKYIEEHSEMSLELFFKEAKLEPVITDLQSKDLQWRRMGPPNRRNYEFITEQHPNLPSALSEFINLFKSRIFFECLDRYTGLELQRMQWEIQKWTAGSFSLISQENAERLDVMYCLGDPDLVGGKMHYVTLEDEVQTALITTECEPNILYLVYGDTARYTSLISKYSKSRALFVFSASYYEAEGASSRSKPSDSDVIFLNSSREDADENGTQDRVAQADTSLDYDDDEDLHKEGVNVEKDNEATEETKLLVEPKGNPKDLKEESDDIETKEEQTEEVLKQEEESPAVTS